MVKKIITALLILLLITTSVFAEETDTVENFSTQTEVTESSDNDKVTDTQKDETSLDEEKTEEVGLDAQKETDTKKGTSDEPEQKLRSEGDFNVSIIYYDTRVNNGRTALNGDTPCVYEENKVSGNLTLQVNILGENVSRDYAPGELEIKVYGLEKFGLTNVSIQGSVFSYEHHEGTFTPETRQVEDDYYIFKNKQTITQDSSVDAMFQLLYRMGNSLSGCPFNGSSGEIYAVYNDEDSNKLSFTFNMPKQQYAYSGTDAQINVTSTDGLGDDADNYYWVRTGYQSTKTVNPSRDMTLYESSSRVAISGLEPGCIVYYLDYNSGRLISTTYDETADEYVYEGSPPTAYIFVGLPKDKYNVGENITLNLDWDGRYYYKNRYNTTYVGDMEDVFDKTYNLTVKDTIEPIPDGYLINFTNYWAGSDFYTSNLSNVNYRDACIAYTGTLRNTNLFKYTLGFDGIYFRNTSDEYVLLDDSYYYIEKVYVPYVMNANSLKINETYSLYVRYRDEDEYVLYRENIAGGQGVTFASSEKVVAAYVVSSAFSGYYTINGSSQALESYVIFEKSHDYYEANGYVGLVGFMDMLDGETGEPLGTYAPTGYNTALTTVNLPAKDLQDYGRYLFRKTVEKKIKPDDYTGFIGIKDTLVTEETGYSDFLLTTYLAFASNTSTPSISGYDAYVTLPPQVRLNTTAAEIKEGVLSESLKTFINEENDSSSIKFFVSRSSQFSSLDEYMEFLYQSLTVTVRDDDGTTVIHLHYDYPEDLLLGKVSSGTSQTFSAVQIPVRVYDTDVLDYGTTIEIAGYAQPILNNNANFYNYNSNGNWPNGHYSNILINPQNKNSSSVFSGYNWPDTIDIDQDGNTVERFNEFHSKVVYGKAMEALQEFSKLVDTDHSHWKTGASYVISGSNYSYRLRTRSAATGMTDLVLYDHIEMYTPDGINSWHGTYTGISLERSEAQGYIPTIYYSENSNAGSLSEDTSWQLYDESVDLTHVKSLAFSYGNQIIEPNSIVSVDIFMHAPETDTDLYTYNKYGAEWRRVDPVTSHVYPDLEEIDSNVTVISLNEVIEDTRNITITKEWEETTPNPDKPTSIAVNLYKDNVLYGSYEVTSREGWEKTIYGLPRFDFETGEEYEYTITEEPVENYDTEIDGFQITNTYNPAQPVPTGGKTHIRYILPTLGWMPSILLVTRQKPKKTEHDTTQ